MQVIEFAISVPSLHSDSPKILRKSRTRSKHAYRTTHRSERYIYIRRSNLAAVNIGANDVSPQWSRECSRECRDCLSLITTYINIYHISSRSHCFFFFFFTDNDRTSLGLCQGKMGAHWPIGESVIPPSFHGILDPRYVSITIFCAKLLICP